MGAPTSVRKRVAASATETLRGFPANTTVQIEPGSGGTMTCKVRAHEGSAFVDIDPDNTSFSAAATYALHGPVDAIQFGATTADGFGSIAF